MRIRGVKQSPAADCSAVSRSTSSWSSSSSSSSSSVTATHSLASSQDSSNSSPFSLITASSRCPGLDLLVKAIHQITAGSVVGVPYIQRRVTIRRRRRRMSELDGFIHTGKGLQNEKKAWTGTKKTSKKKIGRRTVYQMGSWDCYNWKKSCDCSRRMIKILVLWKWVWKQFLDFSFFLQIKWKILRLGSMSALCS